MSTPTHTPSPMGLLNGPGGPSNERPFPVLVAGFPADNATVPVLTKKPLEDITSFL